SLIADRMALDGSSTVAAGGGPIFLQPSSSNQAIILGTTTDSVLELSDTELNTLHTTSVVVIGDAFAGTGDITIGGAIAPTTFGTLGLATSGGGITQTPGATISLPAGENLVTIAGKDVLLTEANAVTGQLA